MAYNRILETVYQNRRNYHFYASCSGRTKEKLINKLTDLLDLTNEPRVNTDLIAATMIELGPTHRTSDESRRIYRSSSVEADYTFSNIIRVRIYKPRKFIRAANKVLVSALQNKYPSASKAGNILTIIQKWRLRMSRMLFKTNLIDSNTKHVFYIKRKTSNIKALQARFGEICIRKLRCEPNAPELIRYLWDNSLSENTQVIKGELQPDGTYELHLFIKDISKFADDAYALAYEPRRFNITHLPSLPNPDDILEFLTENKEVDT